MSNLLRRLVYLFCICLPLFGKTASAENCSVPLREPIKIEDIRTRARDCNVKSTRELLKHLPTTVRSNFTFAYKSSSKVHACITKMSPRLLMWGEYSNIVISMPWDPEANGPVNCNVAEMFELPLKATNYVLGLLEMPRVEAANPNLLRQSPNAKAIADNKRSCSECHGLYFKPIWPNYSDWKHKGFFAFYGSNDDTLIDGTQELRDYLAFLNRIRSDGSASLLVWKNLKMEQSLLSADQLNSDRDRKILYDIPPYQHHATENPRGSAFARPGVRFAHKITEMQAMLLVNRLMTHPDYSKFSTVSLYSRLGCDNNLFDKLPSQWKSLNLDLSVFYSTLIGNVDLDSDIGFEYSTLGRRVDVPTKKAYATFNGDAVVTNYLASIAALKDSELRPYYLAFGVSPLTLHSLNPPKGNPGYESYESLKNSKDKACSILSSRLKKLFNIN